MSIASEMARLQTAKSDLKTSINRKTDAQHKITTETIDDYADFVDSISGGPSPIDVDSDKLKFAYSKFTKIPSYLDFSNVTDFDLMFYGCENLTSISNLDTSNGTTFYSMFCECYSLTSIPNLDTSNGTNFDWMFCECYSLTSIPNLDTSNGTNFDSMFYGCVNLTSIPNLDTSNGTNFDWMFYGCENLTSISNLDTSNGTTFRSMFYGCYSLTTIPELDFSDATNISSIVISDSLLTTLGGFKDLGKNYSVSASANNYLYGLDLSVSSNITYVSLMNVINKLYDIATKGCNTQSVILGSTNIAKLTAAEIAIATNKGWTVS